MSVEMSSFARTIMLQKYAHTKADGSKESWDEIATRVATTVMGAVNAPPEDVDQIAYLIATQKFIPGGRYLYASGRPFHQTQNCLLMRAVDSREGWADHLHKCAMALMTGAGIGIDYSDVREEGAIISKTGGTASGPISLMLMTNECGRGIMQGGSRRSAIWAGLNWKHKDIFKFIHLKDWTPEVKALKEKDFNFPAPMDGTNVSVQLDDEFLKAYHDDKYVYPYKDKKDPDKFAHITHEWAYKVYWETVKQMLMTGEPGFSVDCGENAGETLRNAPVVGGTSIATAEGIKRVKDVVGVPTTVWTGRQWAYDVVFSRTGVDVPVVTVFMTGNRELTCDPTHPFLVERYVGKGKRRKLVSVDRVPACDLVLGDVLHVSLPQTGCSDATFLELYADEYTMGFLYGDGHFRKGHAELSVFADDKLPCFDFIKRCTSYHFSEAEGGKRLYFNTYYPLFGNRDKAEFPKEYLEAGQFAAKAFLAGLFDADGSYDDIQHRVRLGSIHFDFLRDTQRLLEWLGIQSNISKGSNSGYTGAPSWQLVVVAESVSEFARLIPTIRLQPDDHESYRPSLVKVLGVANNGTADVFCADVKVPEHSFMAEGVIISNCTEVTSYDDSDICNLGSINMANIGSLREMEMVVFYGTLFLLAGTEYSDVPYDKVRGVRTANRRLGLGLMGLHEWLLKNGHGYEANEDLKKYMAIYATSGKVADLLADDFKLSRPVKTRAIAPTGTIGIMAGTTTGIEPVFCVAYKRRYLKGQTWHYQYVVDPTAKRLIDSGIHPDKIEDAYTLAKNTEKRVAFQAWLQEFVDHSISSTINLPEWGSELNKEETVKPFGKMLLKYLPKLRGITVYPDGARGGQPLSPVKYSTAMKHEGEIFLEAMDICEFGKGGTCGS